MCLITAAHEDFVTQTCKKSKTALKNFMGSGGRGPTYGAEGQGPRKKKYPFTYTSTSQRINSLKGSAYPFFYILPLFLACLDRTYESCYTFSERLKFEVFKTEKTALKNLN